MYVVVLGAFGVGVFWWRMVCFEVISCVAQGRGGWYNTVFLGLFVVWGVFGVVLGAFGAGAGLVVSGVFRWFPAGFGVCGV